MENNDYSVSSALLESINMLYMLIWLILNLRVQLGAGFLGKISLRLVLIVNLS